MKENKHPIFDKIEEGTVTVDDFNHLIAEATPESARDRNRRRITPLNTRQHLDDEGHQQTELPTFADRVQPKRERADNTQMTHRGKAGHRASTRTQRRKATVEGNQFLLSFDKAGYINSLRDELVQRGITEDEYSLEPSADGGYVFTVSPSFAFDENLKSWLNHVGRAERMGKSHPDIFESQIPARFREGLKFIKENIGKPLEGLLEHIQDKEALNKLAARMMTKPNVNRDWLNELVKKTNE